MIKTTSIVRIRLITAFIVLFALVLVVRLYFVQIVSGDAFKNRAERQYVRSAQDIFDRGSIYFRHSDGSLISAATLKSGYMVSINPDLIKEPEVAYAKLGEIIALDKEFFLAKAAKQNDPYEEIAKRLDQSIAERIDALGIPGVYTYQEKWRYYPQGTLAAHLLGFVGYSGDTRQGQYGLEKQYDGLLARKTDSLYVNFFAEIFSNIRGSLGGGESREADVITFIEPAVQKKIEEELSKIQSKWSSKESGAIIINPVSGEVYAMAALPTFDPNKYQTENDYAIFTNPLVEKVYEMGSIVKPLTVAMGIDSGVITRNSTYVDEGFLTLNNATVYNFDKKGRGTVTIQEALNQSLNTGAAYVASKVGKKNFADYLNRFGLHEKTGIDLPGEAANIVRDISKAEDIELATASYGQGIALSPIATVSALSTLVNGGTRITPHVAAFLDYKQGFSKQIGSKQGERVIKQETAEEVTRMLVEVVDKALLEGSVKIPHYSVAAKTGTALIPKSQGKGYEEGKYLHSFFGYFPAYDPKFLVFLYTIDPKGVTFASHTLTHPFIDITKFLINYYKVPPDR